MKCLLVPDVYWLLEPLVDEALADDAPPILEEEALIDVALF